MRVLLVEDDDTLGPAVAAGLANAGLRVDMLGAAEPAEAVLRSTAYDLLVLDIGLPGASGLALLRALRRRDERLPVLLLTARDGIADRVQGFESGADDYLVKPFAMPELVARCQALIRRSLAAAHAVVEFGGLQLDTGRRECRCGDRTLALTAREWELLQHLMLAAPNVVLKQRLADSLSAWDHEITPNAVEILVSRLRAKLAPTGLEVRAIRGLGYRLEAPAA
ncbi:MAG: response regulator transcription factor [Rubrivivax sp.]